MSKEMFNSLILNGKTCLAKVRLCLAAFLSPRRFWTLYLFYFSAFAYGFQLKIFNLHRAWVDATLPYYDYRLYEPSIILCVTIWLYSLALFVHYLYKQRFAFAILHLLHLVLMLGWVDSWVTSARMLHFLMMKN